LKRHQYALGLAIIVAIASNQTETLENIRLPSIEAINGGFHSAFIVGYHFCDCNCFSSNRAEDEDEDEDEHRKDNCKELNKTKFPFFFH
jgi:hypothetical protein